MAHSIKFALQACVLLMAFIVPVSVFAQCTYPVISLEATRSSWRTYARTQYEKFELLRNSEVTEACLAGWRSYLQNLGHVLMVAGDKSPSEREWFIKREMIVRGLLSRTFRGVNLSPKNLNLYSANLERIVDIYDFNKDRFGLFETIKLDSNFSSHGQFVDKVREVLRRAIYSCNQWNFTHPDDLSHKHGAWKSCLEDFDRLGRDVPALREIAPAAFDFLARSRVEGGDSLPSNKALEESQR